MFKEHLEEISHTKTIEMDNGFIQYRINDDETCFVSEIYIKPEFRKTGITYELEKKVVEKAKEAKCKYIYCQADINNPNLDAAVVTIIKNGYSIIGWEGQLIQFNKELVYE